jgi:hypothetical protein
MHSPLLHMQNVLKLVMPRKTTLLQETVQLNSFTLGRALQLDHQYDLLDVQNSDRVELLDWSVNHKKAQDDSVK